MTRWPGHHEPRPLPAWWTRWTGLPDPAKLEPQGADARWVWDQMDPEHRAWARRASRRPTVADHAHRALVLADLQRQWLPGLGFWRRPAWLGISAAVLVLAGLGVLAGTRPLESILLLAGLYAASFTVAWATEHRRRLAIAANEALAAEQGLTTRADESDPDGR